VNNGIILIGSSAPRIGAAHLLRRSNRGRTDALLSALPGRTIKRWPMRSPRSGRGVFAPLGGIHLADHRSQRYLTLGRRHPEIISGSYTTYYLHMYKRGGSIPSHPFGRHAFGSTLNNIIALRPTPQYFAMAARRSKPGESSQLIAGKHSDIPCMTT
jgi:hypothetical protein